MALEPETYPECADAPECELPGAIVRGRNLLVSDPSTNCDKRLETADEAEYPAIPVQTTSSNVELRSGSITKPIKLPKLQRNQTLLVPSLGTLSADGTFQKWIPLACDGKVIWKDGNFQLTEDVFPEIFNAEFCECEIEDVEFVIGIKSFTYICEETGVEKTLHQACFVEKGPITTGGSVTSVGLSMPTDEFTVVNSPVTTAGVLGVTWKNQAANEFFAGPVSGADATPVFRPIQIDDLGFLASVYQPLDPDLTDISALVGDGFPKRVAGVWTMDPGGGSGTVTSVGITPPAAGIGVAGSPVTTSGSITLSLTNDLAALEGLAGVGYSRRTAVNTWQLDATIPNSGLTNPNITIGDQVVVLGTTIVVLTGLDGISLDTGQILLPNGNSGVPSLSFNGDPDTGLYGAADNSLRVTTGGTLRYIFDSGGNFIQQTGSQIRINGGTAPAPGISGRTDTNTGINIPGGDLIEFVTGANIRWSIDSAGTLLGNGLGVSLDTGGAGGTVRGFSPQQTAALSQPVTGADYDLNFDNFGAISLTTLVLDTATNMKFGVTAVEAGQQIKLMMDGGATGTIYVGPIPINPATEYLLASEGTSFEVHGVQGNWYIRGLTGSLAIV